MKTGLLEHFYNVEIPGWELHHHNIGLKPTPGYKTGFIVRTDHGTFQMYDKLANLISTMITTGLYLMSIHPVPSRGKIVAISSNNTGSAYYVDIFDGKTGSLQATIPFTSVSSLDIFENGDIYILNPDNGDLLVYDIKGDLKNTVPAIISTSGDQSVFVNSKLGLVAIDNNYDKIIDIHNKKGISATPRIDDMPIQYRIEGFTLRGNFTERRNTITEDKLRYIYHMDYSRNTVDNIITHNLSMPVDVNGQAARFYYLTNFKENIYYYGVSDEDRMLTRVDENTGIHENRVLLENSNVLHLDDEILILSNSSNYYIYNMEDLALLYTIPVAYSSKMAVSTKGEYRNFYKYW